jgi:type IV pilus assembly protein PilA
MTQQWYYADRQRQQCGPVSVDELAAALQRGDVDMTTLVWHERLPAWVPLAQVAAELGLRGAPPPLPRAAAQPRRAPPRPMSGKKVALIVVGALLVCSLPVIAILAAIAIPAYQDYTQRSKVAQAYIVAVAERTSVAEFYLSEERCPRNGDDGFNTPESYANPYLASLEFVDAGDGDGCEIRAALRNLGARMEGARLVLHMDRQQHWSETGENIPPRYLPSSMRRNSP